MDSGASGHALPDETFARVKLKRKTSPKRFVAANGEKSETLVTRLFHSRQTREFKDASHPISASVVKPLISKQKSCPSQKHLSC